MHPPHSKQGEQGGMPSQGAGTAVHPHKAACQEPKCAHMHVLSAFTCTYFDEVGMGSFTDNQIRFAVKIAAKALQYKKGASPSTGLTRIRCGQEGHAPSSWQDMMLWRSRSWGAGSSRAMRFWSMYIQQQLSTFSKGIATGMSRIATFTNMEGSTERKDLRHQTIF